MPNKIVIVGGGLAGTIIANGLCRQLGTELRSGEISITMETPSVFCNKDHPI